MEDDIKRERDACNWRLGILRDGYCSCRLVLFCKDVFFVDTDLFKVGD